MNHTSITGLACLLAVALTACAGGGEPPAPSGSPAPAPLEALKEPANSMPVSPPLSPTPVSAEALAAYRALLAGEPGALDRPPEGLELHQVTLPPAEELEYVLLDLDGDGGAELVVLAGFLSILGEKVIARYRNRILNVHPSLIPAFCGKGFYGLKVHEAALAYGVKVTGATVHLVNEIPDGGAIVLQKAVAVQPADTPETLQLRVMRQAEWELLPQAVSLFCEGKIRVEGNIAVVDE